MRDGERTKADKEKKIFIVKKAEIYRQTKKLNLVSSAKNLHIIELRL